MTDLDKHQRMANAIRFLAIDAVEKANSGHPGLPMGAADIATVLFTEFLKFDPTSPNWADRDRFVLSAGHGSMLLYSLLYLLGYEDFSLDEIKNFRQLGARTAGHPEYGHGAGIETTTGPLGQGLGERGSAWAIAERLQSTRFGEDLVDHYTYVLAGDGCLMEGISQEALSLAGHLKLNKLIVIWDDNGISIDGKVEITDSTDQQARFAASGWNTLSVDGHDPVAISAAIRQAQASDRPTLIAAKTTIGFGAPTKAGTAKVHARRLVQTKFPAPVPRSTGRTRRLKFQATFWTPGALPDFAPPRLTRTGRSALPKLTPRPAPNLSAAIVATCRPASPRPFWTTRRSSPTNSRPWRPARLPKLFWA